MSYQLKKELYKEHLLDALMSCALVQHHWDQELFDVICAGAQAAGVCHHAVSIAKEELERRRAEAELGA